VPARLVERADEQRPEPFTQRVLRHQTTQFRHDRGRATAGDVRLDAQLDSGEPQLGRLVGLSAEQRGLRDVGEQRPAPEPECLGEQCGGSLRVGGAERAPAVGDERLELVDVQVSTRDAQLVAGCTVNEQPALNVADDLAQPVHVDADHVVGRARRVVPPHLGDQGLGRDDLAGAHQQGGKQRPPFGGADSRPAIRGQHLERPQDAITHQAGCPNARSPPAPR